jgi:malate dehydrogenase
MDLGKIVLLDVNADIPRGKALDLSQAAVLEGHAGDITGTADYRDTAGSDLVIVTAGIARKAGMSRDDLLKINAGIVTQVMQKALQASPQALFIVTSNPVNVMCRLALKTMTDHRRLIGLSGVLDGARMRAQIALTTGVPVNEVQGFVLGDHGDTMVPLPRLAVIGGVPATALLSAGQLAEVSKKTISGGADIINLTGCSSFYAPGIALAVMAHALLNDSRTILPCSTYLQGQYGEHDVYMCVPVRLGRKGVEEIIEVVLEDGEKAALARTAAHIRANFEVVAG